MIAQSKWYFAPMFVFCGMFFIPLNSKKMTNTSEAKAQIHYKISDNPLLFPWEGSYRGFPPFDKVKIEDFKPAFESAMQEQLSEIDKIAGNTAPPTFENTIVPLEKSGDALDRVQTIFGIWSSTMNSSEFQPIEREITPMLAAFSDKIIQNEKLFKRIEAVYNSPEKQRLTPEQQRLVWLDYTNFVKAGAKLDSTNKAKLSEINQNLAKLFTRFRQNLLADETEPFLVIENEKDLAGLPPSVIESAKQQAGKKQLADKWVISNTRSSIDPFLTFAENRALREKAWRMFVNRGDNADKNDNNAIITEILQQRKERARLLGFETHAHWRLQNTMAQTPARTLELMEAVWTPAIKRVAEEVNDMQNLARKSDPSFVIEPWDYRYYAEKVRKEKYDLDQNQVKEYLQLEKLREGMFWVAGKLFGFKFTPITDVPVYHTDVQVWRVTDQNTGRHIGLWYFDAYARDGKRSGAWMNAYRKQQKLQDVSTIVSNNSNFIKGKPGEPVLISWDDAKTLFHEFGHALHGLSSNVTYPSLAGTQVPRDYVEFPSQLLEHWLSTPEVLSQFALHYKTGKPLPKELADRIAKASTFNQGFETTEYLASALVDMKLHLSKADKIDPDQFERETLEALKMPKQIVMRHRLPQFAHIFSSDAYSAGYYSYLWSDVITADAYGAFTEANGPYDQSVASRLYNNVFSVGNTIDPAQGYRNFRGRDPKIDALMVKRGFK